MARPRQCVKHRYPNQGVALKVLRQIHQLGLPKNQQQRAYWCEDGCGGWHLTSQPLRGEVDLTDADRAEDREQLRVYESPDVARAAVFVAVACPDVGISAPIADLVGQWRRQYPRHDEPSKSASGRARLLRGLRALDSVGIVHLSEEDGRVTVLDIDGLHMVAGNRDIFEDHNGLARKPSRWPRNPEVPAHLRDLQASLVAAGVVGWKRVGKGSGRTGAQPPTAADPRATDPAVPAAGPIRRMLRRLVALLSLRRTNRFHGEES